MPAIALLSFKISNNQKKFMLHSTRASGLDFTVLLFFQVVFRTALSFLYLCVLINVAFLLLLFFFLSLVA